MLSPKEQQLLRQGMREAALMMDEIIDDLDKTRAPRTPPNRRQSWMSICHL